MKNTPYIENAHINIEQEFRLLNDSWELVIEKDGMSLPEYIHYSIKLKPELTLLLKQWYIQIHPEFNKDQFEVASYGKNSFSSVKDIMLTTYTWLSEVLAEQWETIDLRVLPPEGPAIWHTEYKPYYPLLAKKVIEQTGDSNSIKKFDITSCQFNIDDPELTLYRAIADDFHQHGFFNSKYGSLRSPHRAKIFKDIIDRITETWMISWGIYPPYLEWVTLEEPWFLPFMPPSSYDRMLRNDELLKYFLDWPNTQHYLEIKSSDINNSGHYLEIKPFDLWVENHGLIESGDWSEIISKRYDTIYKYLIDTHDEYDNRIPQSEI